ACRGRRDQLQAGQGGQDEPSGRAGGLPVVQPVDLGGRGEVAAGLPFDQAEDQQGEADHGDQGGDPPVVLQEHRGDREGSFEVAVAALDGFLALVAEQHLAGGDGGVQVGQQRVPAVGGGFGVDGVLGEVPRQGGLAGAGVGAGAVAEVGADFAVAGDLRDPVGDLLLVGVEPAAEAAGEAVKVVCGAGEFLVPAGGGSLGAGGGVHEDAAQLDHRVFFALGVTDLERDGVLQHVPAADLAGPLAGVAGGDIADLGGPGHVAGGQLGGLHIRLGGGREERAALIDDGGDVVIADQLGVSDQQESPGPGDLLQRRHRAGHLGHLGGAAVVGTVVDGDPAVAGGRDPGLDLQQVVPAVLGVTVPGRRV